MRTSFRKNLLKILSVLSILIALPTPSALADSIYDGIWESNWAWPTDRYYSITITNGKILMVSLDEVALYQDPLRGAYIGPLPMTDGSSLLPGVPFSVYTKTEHLPETRFYSAWHINFYSENMAQIFRPPALNVSPLPPITLRKIF